jgi:hypothetical protein
MQVHAHFRCYMFAGCGIFFVKTKEHDIEIHELTERMKRNEIQVMGGDVGKAAAWTVACELWNMPPAGWA